MTELFATTFHAVARPAALFLAGVTVAVGTLAAAEWDAMALELLD